MYYDLQRIRYDETNLWKGSIFNFEERQRQFAESSLRGVPGQTRAGKLVIRSIKIILIDNQRKTK